MSRGWKNILLVSISLTVLLIIATVLSLREYNFAIAMDETVKNEWVEIENQLKRRFDLIPNLAETVKGVAQQEEKIYLGVAEARKSYFQAEGIEAKARAADVVEGALSRLLLLKETYPQLKSDKAFRRLMGQLEGTENRLAVARKRYNDSVTQLNWYIRSFPGKFFAGILGIRKAEHFKVEESEKSVPKLDF